MGEHCTASGTPDSFQLLHAVNASGEVIFMTNREGVITFVNREFVRLYGYTAEEVVGRTTPRLLKSGCTSEETYASLWNRLEHGEMVRGDMVNRTKQGAMVHVEFSANPVRDERNEIIGFLGIQRDVTARHRMETALRESEARYRTLAEAAHDHIFIIDVDGRYQYINAAGAALFNLRPDEVFGKKLDDCFPADLAATVESQVQQVQRTRVPLYVEQAMQFPQGEIWQSAWLAPILDQHQQVTGVMGISRDITERRRLAALLERHDSLLNAVIESSPIGIAVLDGASFVCNTVNPAFQRLTSGRAVVGYPFKHVWPADAEDTTLTPMFKRVLSTGIPDECVDLLVQSPSSGDENRHDAWVTVTASPLLLPGSTVPTC
jgi:PAS domain S-box-containing protein